MLAPFVSFGPVYLDFMLRQEEGEAARLLYGNERVLQSHAVQGGKDNFSLLLADSYDGKRLEVSLRSSVERGEATISLDGTRTSGAYETALGGSTANFAVQLQRLGMNPLLVGTYGKNACGRRVRDLLKGSVDSRLSEFDALQTITINVLHPGTQEAAMLTSGGSNRELNLELLTQAFSEVIGPGTFLYAGGFFKQEHLFPHYPEIFQAARMRGATVILDHGRFLDAAGSPKFLEEVAAARSALQYVDIYLPNKLELEGLTGQANVEDALREAASMGPGLVVCKRGAEGASFIDGKRIYHLPQQGRGGDIISLVGAGDFFNAILVTVLKKGGPVETAVSYANLGAYHKITVGTAPTLAQLESAQLRNALEDFPI